MSPLVTTRLKVADFKKQLQPRLDVVRKELARIIAADFPLIAEVNSHLLQMQGKLFRPTMALLADEATGGPTPRAERLAAVVELIHVARWCTTTRWTTPCCGGACPRSTRRSATRCRS